MPATMLPKILIVEDERAIADTLVYVLKTEGFTPVWCDMGEEALKALHEDTFALVILDVGLPDVSGFEVCRRLRTFSQVPVLFLTARNEEVDRIVGLEIGADDYVTKPFSPREVAARVRTILRRAPCALPPQGFQVDATKRRIAFQGTPLELTRFEYDLLRTLLLHPGRIYTRAELMQSVWAGAEETLDRTVDTHIKTLRAKLRQAVPGADPICTHRGVGYSVST